MSPRVFPKLRRMHKYRNLPLCNQLSPFVSCLLSHMVEKKYFHGNMRTYKIVGRSPTYLAFFYWGRSLKIHTEIKRELFTWPPK
jgi:hypothetical protein